MTVLSFCLYKDVPYRSTVWGRILKDVYKGCIYWWKIQEDKNSNTTKIITCKKPVWMYFKMQFINLMAKCSEYTT